MKTPDDTTVKPQANCGDSKPGRQMALGRAAVSRINIRIEDAVEGHRRRPCGDHRNNNPQEAQSSNQECGSWRRVAPASARERKWQRKHRVLELNHFEREP